MGKLTTEVFNESCCDGGATNPNDMSAQPCGCDPGANYISPHCKLHQIVKMVKTGMAKDADNIDKALFLDSIPEVFGRTVPDQFYDNLIERNNELAYREAISPIKLGLPTDDQSRKKLPLWSGVLMYFPDALLAVSEVSRIGNDQHNPGQPLHWERGKSTDQMNTAVRHMVDHGTGKRYDKDGARHLAKAAWRILAELQLDIENEKGH